MWSVKTRDDPRSSKFEYNQAFAPLNSMPPGFLELFLLFFCGGGKPIQTNEWLQ